MSIRGRLSALMLAIGLIPTLCVGAVSYVIIGNELSKKTIDQLESTASKQEQKISGQLQAKQEEATKLTNRFDLQSALEKYRASNGKVGGQELYDVLINKKVAAQDIQDIYVTGLDGRLAATTVNGNVDAGKMLEASKYYVNPSQETTISLQEDQRDGIDKLFITSNVNVNKKPAGVLTLVFRIDDIVAAVQDYTGLGQTGETVVAMPDKDGKTVSLFPLRFNTDAALNQDLTQLHLSDKLKSGQVRTDYRGHEVMAATRPVAATNWTLAAKIDRSEVLAPIANLRQASETIIIVSSVLIALIAFYFTRFFTRPIIRIAETAQRIGRGDFTAKIDMKRRDEVGRLAGSINAMGTSLQEFVSHIESQRTRLEVILNSAKEGILAIDSEGAIIIANAAASQLTKLPVDKIVGQRIGDIFDWQQGKDHFALDYSLEGSHTYTDIMYTDKESDLHYLKLVVTSIAGQHKDTAQAIITIHDETKDRDLENMKVDFVSMAAHELRTPLAAIRGYLELIVFKMEGNLPKEVNRYLDLSIKSTAELGGLIANLLDVTRIERGNLSLHFEKVDLAADLCQAVKDAGFNATEKNITLRYSGPEADCPVIADKITMHEVMNNLLSNAIKYTDKGGDVTVSLRHQDGKYLVDIKDTGIGIPKAAIDHLFTKFYRVHGGLNSGSTGTGLGLFISQSIAQRHGGDISVQSKEGEGSTFTFSVPVYDEQRLQALQPKDQDANVKTIRRKRGWTTQNIAR